MMVFGVLITFLYVTLIGGFIYGFDKIKSFHLKHLSSKTTFSIVIPFRNEAKNLRQLLQSIEALKYPGHLLEIILIDDASEDSSIEVIEPFLKKPNLSIQIISNERRTESPKKDAITLAITEAKNEWIITTDADCVLPKYWLNSFDEYIQQSDAACIAAPVSYRSEKNFLNHFQILDLLSLQGATIGGFGINKPFLCNGANFAYQKTKFIELHGFKGNTRIASGDDIFLLEKMVKANSVQVDYLKCQHAIVKTIPETSWNDLVSQRIRWASKTNAYNNWFGKSTGIIVLVMNALIILALVLTFFSHLNTKVFIYLVIMKFYIDFFLIYKSAVFFNQRDILKTHLIGFFFYTPFSIYIVFKSIVSSYEWKERSFKR